jgi:hypothetical protein
MSCDLEPRPALLLRVGNGGLDFLVGVPRPAGHSSHLQSKGLLTFVNSAALAGGRHRLPAERGPADDQRWPGPFALLASHRRDDFLYAASDRYDFHA